MPTSEPTHDEEFRGWIGRPEPDPVEPEWRYEPIHPRSDLRERLKKLASPLVAGAVLLGKFGGALLKLKGITTIGSAFVSVAAYAWLWGWQFAIGFVALIFVHELGHAFVLRRQGVPTSPVLFIPFVGAVIGMKQLPKDAWREAQVALAGPLVGSLGAVACLVAARATDSNLLQALAYAGFLINLINLIPVVPLDGGRAAAALHPAVWLVGLAGITALAVVWHVWFLLVFFLVFGAPELLRRFRNRHLDAAYYRVAPRQRLAVGITYLGLAGALIAGMHNTYVKRGFGDDSSSASSGFCALYWDGGSRSWKAAGSQDTADSGSAPPPAKMIVSTTPAADGSSVVLRFTDGTTAAVSLDACGSS
jgi:Zn-dependent protease